MFDRLTDSSRKAVVRAQELARESGKRHVGADDLMLAILSFEDSVPAQALIAVGRPEGVLGPASRMSASSDSQSEVAIPFSQEAKRALAISLHEFVALGGQHIELGHLMLGLLRDLDSAVARCLATYNVPVELYRARIIELLQRAPS